MVESHFKQRFDLDNSGSPSHDTLEPGSEHLIYQEQQIIASFFARINLFSKEFPAGDITATKSFVQKVFNWRFQDYGPDYTAFSNAGLEGGFFQSELVSSTQNGAALIVFYSLELESSMKKITDAGGSIVRPIFDFPGGRRFHFADPNGNEYAIRSDK